MANYQPNYESFHDGPIEGATIQWLTPHHDERGSLAELFRIDEIAPAPVMGYISQTVAKTQRGPHLHDQQTDHFVVLGSQTFEFCLWDDRTSSPTGGNRSVIHLPSIANDAPQGPLSAVRLCVPAGVVHAYRNVGNDVAWLLNFPDRLYQGEQRSAEVDEIRFEDIGDHPFHW